MEYSAAFEIVWKKYPRPIGKKLAFRYFKASVKTEQDIQDMQKALCNYTESEGFKNGYIQYGSTWFNNWRDWLDYRDPKEAQKNEAELKKIQAGLANLRRLQKVGGDYGAQIKELEEKEKTMKSRIERRS